MKRRMILTAWLLTVILSAANAVSLVVVLKDGTREIINFDRQPTVTYEFGEMWIKSYQGRLYYDCSEVVRFDIDNSQTGIQSVNATGMKYTITGNTVVTVEGLTAADGAVDVFDAGGRQTASLKPDSTGKVTVSLEAEPAGVYLIKINGKRTIKAVKR